MNDLPELKNMIDVQAYVEEHLVQLAKDLHMYICIGQDDSIIFQYLAISLLTMGYKDHYPMAERIISNAVLIKFVNESYNR